MSKRDVGARLYSSAFAVRDERVKGESRLDGRRVRRVDATEIVGRCRACPLDPAVTGTAVASGLVDRALDLVLAPLLEPAAPLDLYLLQDVADVTPQVHSIK